MSVKEQKCALVIKGTSGKIFPCFPLGLPKSIMRRVIDSRRHPVPDVYTVPLRDSDFRCVVS